MLAMARRSAIADLLRDAGAVTVTEVESRFGVSPMAWTAELPGSEPVWRSFRIQQPSGRFHDVKMDASSLTPEAMQ